MQDLLAQLDSKLAKLVLQDHVISMELMVQQALLYVVPWSTCIPMLMAFQTHWRNWCNGSH